jgi:hypothetical protein
MWHMEIVTLLELGLQQQHTAAATKSNSSSSWAGTETQTC